jgi:catechol 2,3-dioxygenase-like lactoylglutathione lyase family enzyme
LQGVNARRWHWLQTFDAYLPEREGPSRRICTLAQVLAGIGLGGVQTSRQREEATKGGRFGEGETRMIEVNGLAHVILTVSDWPRARAFYAELLPFLGMKKVYDGNNFLYHVGGRTALGIQRCAPEHEGQPFVQNRIGLHHLCLRARTREDVDKVAAKLGAMGATIDRGPVEGDWAPGYYYLVFEDPDGIRLEVNFIPGKGLLAADPPLNPSADPDWDQNAGPPRF